MSALDLLRNQRDLDGLTAMFRSLGYEIELTNIQTGAWARLGTGRFDGGICHAARNGTSDLYFVQSSELQPDAVRSFFRALHQWNALVDVSMAVVTPRSLALFSSDGSRTSPLRLEIALDAPTDEAVRRIDLLHRGSGRNRSFHHSFARALDREATGRSFFLRFRKLVRELSLELRQTRGEAQTECEGEALLILSRLLFLHFIQRKGWLGGDPGFLSKQVAAACEAELNVYRNVLAPLFFDCLNTPVRSRPFAAQKLGAIPYLNGGLFQPSPFELRNGEMTISNELIERIFEEVFGPFRFSIHEGDGDVLEIDPEMLGKVFESLMEDGERAASGTFYTPRSVVTPLTRRALIASCSKDDESLAGALVRSLDEGVPLDPQYGRGVLDWVRTVTVLDPACGSGAFLLGALETIEQLWRLAAETAGEAVPENVRETIVENALFGVDVSSDAVRLCELRLWLAIVAPRSTPDVSAIAPLPNLDRNIMQGNSLLSPADAFTTGRREIYRYWSLGLEKHAALIARYRHAPPSERPSLARALRHADEMLAQHLLEQSIAADEQELTAGPQQDSMFSGAVTANPVPSAHLSARIEQNRAALARLRSGQLDFFAYDVHFGHVLGSGGFNVVVGNPPWVRASRIDGEQRRLLRDRYQALRSSDRRFSQPDLSLAFVERALELVRRDGAVSMLLPAKVLTAGYAARLRRRVERTCRVVAIDDWSADSRRLFDADTFPIGLTVAKTSSSPATIEVSDGNERFVTTPMALTSCDGSWQLVPAAVHEVIGRISERYERLDEVLLRRPLMGVKTGANRLFFLDDPLEFRNGSAVLADGVEVPLEAICRCVRGRDVKRWSAEASTWMLWPPLRGWSSHPEWLRRLASLREVEPEDLTLSYVRPEHLGVKVAWKDVSRGVQAVVLPATARAAGRDFPLVPNQTLYSIDAGSLDEAYLLSALMNSTVFGALAVTVADRAKDAHFRYFGSTIGAIPLPPPDLIVGSDALVRAARRAHRDGAAAAAIDDLVRRAYHVTPAEYGVLDRWLQRKLQAADAA